MNEGKDSLRRFSLTFIFLVFVWPVTLAIFLFSCMGSVR